MGPRALIVGLVALLALGAGAAVASVGYSDVPRESTHAEGIEWATGLRIVQGFPDGTYRPGQAVTRGQLATILYNQGAYMGPAFRMSAECGTATMTVDDANHRGSTAATVTYSVNGGDRHVTDEVPAHGNMTFTPGDTGLVELYVDNIQVAVAHTAEDCTDEYVTD